MRSGILAVILLFSIILTAGIALAESFTLSSLERPPYYFTTEKGAAAGNLRYLMCGQGVDAELLGKLDVAIRKLYPTVKSLNP